MTAGLEREQLQERERLWSEMRDGFLQLLALEVNAYMQGELGAMVRLERVTDLLQAADDVLVEIRAALSASDFS